MQTVFKDMTVDAPVVGKLSDYYDAKYPPAEEEEKKETELDNEMDENDEVRKSAATNAVKVDHYKEMNLTRERTNLLLRIATTCGI